MARMAQEPTPPRFVDSKPIQQGQNWMLARQPERMFQSQVVRYAELMGWHTWHDRATNQRATCRRCRAKLCCAACGEAVTVIRNAAGFLDLVLVRRPRVIFAELKAERGRLTDDQRAWLHALDGCTVERYLWRPSDWQTIEGILR